MSRSTATIRCPFCPYGAKHTSDSPQEVVEFLKRILFEHFSTIHPEQKEAVQLAEPTVDKMIREIAGHKS